MDGILGDSWKENEGVCLDLLQRTWTNSDRSKKRRKSFILQGQNKHHLAAVLSIQLDQAKRVRCLLDLYRKSEDNYRSDWMQMRKGPRSCQNRGTKGRKKKNHYRGNKDEGMVLGSGKRRPRTKTSDGRKKE